MSFKKGQRKFDHRYAQSCLPSPKLSFEEELARRKNNVQSGGYEQIDGYVQAGLVFILDGLTVLR